MDPLIMDKKIFFAALTALGVLIGILAAPPPAAGAGEIAYLSPRPDARYIHPATSLAVRAGPVLDPGVVFQDVFNVIGSRSGVHTGRNALSDDGRTLLFYPDRPFAFDEIVRVTIRETIRTIHGENVGGISYRFRTVTRALTAAEVADAAAYFTPAPVSARGAQVPGPYYTHPEFQDIMTTTVTIPPGQTDGSYIFLTAMNATGSATWANMILEESGEPVYIALPESGEFFGDLKVVSYQGEPHLGYHSGEFHGSWSSGKVYLMDASYTVVNSWTIENGYNADFHEFLILENDHALLLGYLPTPYDLSPYGGPVDGIVYDMVIQEQDTAKNVVFEWHGLDHFDLEDSFLDPANSPMDFMHSNAIEVDLDGNLLLSSRHLNEITKIDRSTGDVIWHMGGENNQFTFTNDIGFNLQHDIRRLPNGHITLFDNGNQHTPPHSRAVEYAVDENALTVTRVWQYPSDTSLFAPFMGSAQRLDNGNTLIGWGALPMFTEVLADGTVTYEVLMNDLSYRAVRSSWSGIPAQPPRAALAFPTGPDFANLYASWNGATGITGYEI